MDDDDLAALLRSQTTAAPLPSWSDSNPSPTLDPFANPFADGPSRSTGPAYGSASVFASGNGGSFGGINELPSAAERRDTTEVNDRIEEIFIAQSAGDGVQDVSPYVTRIQEDTDPYYRNSSSEMQRQGSGHTITGLEERDVFGTAAGFDLDTPYVPPPISRHQSSSAAAVENTGFINSSPSPFGGTDTYPIIPHQPLPTSLYQTPTTPPSTSYNPNPLSTPLYQSQHVQQASSSPVQHASRVLPSSLLTPDILGTTHEDSLKKAFVKSSSSSASSPVATDITKSPQKDKSTLGKQPYVFRPGGNPKAKKTGAVNVSRTGSLSNKERKVEADKKDKEGKEIDIGIETTVKDIPGTSKVLDKEVENSKSITAEKEGALNMEGAKFEQPIKSPAKDVIAGNVNIPDAVEESVELKQEVKVENSEANPSVVTVIKSEDEVSDAIKVSSPPPVGPQAAKQISNGPHPTSAANEAIKSSQPDDHPIIENGLVKDLRQLPPLPLSEQSTPRAGSPVAPPSEPSHEHVNGHAEVPPPKETPETSHHAPHSVSTTSPRSSLKYDKVSVSPLDQPPQSDRYERGFSSLSLGGNAAFGGGFSSTGPTSSFASTSQSSWGRTYDEPEENPASSWGPNEGHAPVAAVGSTWDGGHTVDRNGERQSEWVGDAQSDHTNGEAVPQPAQSHQRTISTSSKRSFGSATRDKPPIQQMFTITLSDPTKVGDPIRGHVVYTITTRTTSPHYRRAEFSVLRRFSDFLWLFEAVSSNNPGVIVPPVPDKHPFGRFEDQFIETRRAALERCLGKMANHPVLGLDPDLRLFLESDTFAIDMKHRRSEMTQDKQGLLAGFGGTLIGNKFHEQDEWFNEKKLFLDSLESQLKGLIKSVETTSKQRLDLAISISELADATTALSECDLSQDLTEVLDQMATLIAREKDQQEAQAKMDVVHLLNTADEYLRTIASVRLAFASRIKSYHTWQAVEADAKKLKVQHEKLRKQGKIAHDRIGPALTEIAEAERRGVDAHSDFEAVSRLVKIEFARFDIERMEDIKCMLERYLDGMILRQKELISAWEKFHSVCARLVQQQQA